MFKTNITEDLYKYAIRYGVQEHHILKELREYTYTIYQAEARMQISQDQGQFMGFLAKLINAKKYLEIGVFTGYSTIAMTLAMGQDSKTFALDNNQDTLKIAHKFWDKANISKQIDVFCDKAINSLEKIILDHKNTFDIAFIDADKTPYKEYYEYCYQLVRPGGLIMIDNTFIHGLVLEDEIPNYAKAIKEFNEFIYQDTRIEMCLLPIGDGLTLAQKRPNLN